MVAAKISVDHSVFSKSMQMEAFLPGFFNILHNSSSDLLFLFMAFASVFYDYSVSFLVKDKWPVLYSTTTFQLL